MNRVALALVLVLVLLLPWTPPAVADGTTVLEVAGVEALGEGELDSLELDARGILRPGPAFDAVDLDASTTWALLRVGDNDWVGTGNAGEVLRVDAEGKVHCVPVEGSLLVTALAPRPDGRVLAAVFPGARLVTVSEEGETSTFATLPAEYIWALLPDGKGGFVAATGLPGALFAVDPFGAVEKLAEIGDDHARCLARMDEAWIVGTAPKGLIVRVRDGAVDVVRDLDAQEVVGVVPFPSGGLLVAANADETGGNPQKIAGLLNQITTPSETKPDQKATPRASLQDGSVLFIEPSGAVTVLWAQPKVAALALAGDDGSAVVGTYPSGRLVRVEPGEPYTLLADLPEAEVSALCTGAGGIQALVTSNPAVLHRRRDAPPGGTWTSAPLDAGATARWGRIRVTGSGIEGLEWRSGETGEPDDAWSDWRGIDGFDGSGGGCSAVARFLQVRVTLAGADASLRGVRLVAAAPNRAPVIEDLTWKREGDKEDGTVPEASPVLQFTWKAEDPDGDRLRVNLHAQREDSPHWIELVDGKVLEKPAFEWNTAGVPDGAYVIRLVVSDAPDTPPDRAREAVRFSAPLRVDNTPPRVTLALRMAGNRLLVEGEAVDQAGGRIASVRASVDGGPWQVLSPVDGIFDEAAEGFEGSLESPGSGAHDIVVQARDDHGNIGAAASVVRVR